MDRKIVLIDAVRECYGADDFFEGSMMMRKETMTVGDLIEFLEGCDPEARVILSHDSGYTYGGITYQKIQEAVVDSSGAIEVI
jgi:hypothetical protein